MADVKISGLTTVAAFAPSTTQEFPVNDVGTSRKITAAQIAAYFPQGTIVYAEATAAQNGITAVVDVTSLTATFTAVAARRYRLTAYVVANDATDSDAIIVQITDAANTVLVVGGQSVANGQDTGITVLRVIVPGAGSKTYKVRCGWTGSGVVNLQDNSAPSFFLVEDIGT
jgi:hypothetical protein